MRVATMVLGILLLSSGHALCEQGTSPQQAQAQSPTSATPPSTTPAPASPLSVTLQSPIHVQMPPPPSKGWWEEPLAAALVAAIVALIGMGVSYWALSRQIKHDYEKLDRQTRDDLEKLDRQVAAESKKDADNLAQRRARYMSLLWADAFVIAETAKSRKDEIPKERDAHPELFHRLKIPRPTILTAELEELSLFENAELFIWLPVLRNILDRIDRRVDYIVSVIDSPDDQMRQGYVQDLPHRFDQCAKCAEKIMNFSRPVDQKLEVLKDWYKEREPEWKVSFDSISRSTITPRKAKIDLEADG